MELWEEAGFLCNLTLDGSNFATCCVIRKTCKILNKKGQLLIDRDKYGALRL